MRMHFTLITQLVLVTVVAAQDTDRFKIVTQGTLRFTEASASYTLGTRIEEFTKKFGPAEKVDRDLGDRVPGYLAHTTNHGYINDGLSVTASKDGVITGFTFYVLPAGDYKSSRVSTDTGIRIGSSLREIVKLQGEPYKREEFKYSEIDWVKLYYRYGEMVLCFGFDAGRLSTIGMYAGYLPYLDK